MLSFEDLEAIRHKLTLFYVNSGYITSGAVIPDQKVENGAVTFQIIEGKLTKIQVHQLGKLRPRYIESRLRLGAESPLNINSLSEQIQILHQNPLIHRLDAELAPGFQLGESLLNVSVEEEFPYLLEFSFANDRSPGIGAYQGTIHGAFQNLTGWGDSLGIQYGITEGMDNVALYYEIPLTAQNTILKFYYEKSDSIIVESPFDEIDIESESETYGFSLKHPFYKTLEKEFSLTFTGEKRNSKTFLLGNPYSFSPGVQDGESDISVIRFSQNWLSRSPKQVFAVRSVFSFGIDALDATINPEGPDGQFFAWLGQMQWARKFDFLSDTQLIFRTDMQFTPDPLLPLEKFSVGGVNSVRGYREGLMVRDNGLVSSIEMRLPIFRIPLPEISRTTDDGTVQLCFFGDWGWAENRDMETPDPRSISSCGLGFRWDPSQKIHSEIYWGIPFRDIEHADKDIQDSGIHFRLDCRAF